MRKILFTYTNETHSKGVFIISLIYSFVYIFQMRSFFDSDGFLYYLDFWTKEEKQKWFIHHLSSFSVAYEEKNNSFIYWLWKFAHENVIFVDFQLNYVLFLFSAWNFVNISSARSSIIYYYFRRNCVISQNNNLITIIVQTKSHIHFPWERKMWKKMEKISLSDKIVINRKYQNKIS